jgi:hypothetical protein
MAHLTTLADKAGAPLTPGEADANIQIMETRTAEGWRDNIIPFDIEVGNPNAPVLNIFVGNIKRYSFFAGELTEAGGSWHIDHDYKMGTPLYLHVHWSYVGADIGTVRWGFEYTVAKGHQQAAFPEPTTVYVEQSTTGVSRMHYVAEVSDADAIPGAGIEPDTLIQVRCFRDGAHANDTLDGDIFGLCMDLHYLADKATTPNKAPNFFGA